jgi:hypothetical protein
MVRNRKNKKSQQSKEPIDPNEVSAADVLKLKLKMKMRNFKMDRRMGGNSKKARQAMSQMDGDDKEKNELYEEMANSVKGMGKKQQKEFTTSMMSSMSDDQLEKHIQLQRQTNPSGAVEVEKYLRSSQRKADVKKKKDEAEKVAVKSESMHKSIKTMTEEEKTVFKDNKLKNMEKLGMTRKAGSRRRRFGKMKGKVSLNGMEDSGESVLQPVKKIPTFNSGSVGIRLNEMSRDKKYTLKNRLKNLREFKIPELKSNIEEEILMSDGTYVCKISKLEIPSVPLFLSVPQTDTNITLDAVPTNERERLETQDRVFGKKYNYKKVSYTTDKDGEKIENILIVKSTSCALSSGRFRKRYNKIYEFMGGFVGNACPIQLLEENLEPLGIVRSETQKEEDGSWKVHWTLMGEEFAIESGEKSVPSIPFAVMHCND